jgi:hypothetical protein
MLDNALFSPSRDQPVQHIVPLDQVLIWLNHTYGMDNGRRTYGIDNMQVLFNNSQLSLIVKISIILTVPQKYS